MKCRFCPDKAHSKECGKCGPCCRADASMVPLYHPPKTPKGRRK